MPPRTGPVGEEALHGPDTRGAPDNEPSPHVSLLLRNPGREMVSLWSGGLIPSVTPL